MCSKQQIKKQSNTDPVFWLILYSTGRLLKHPQSTLRHGPKFWCDLVLGCFRVQVDRFSPVHSAKMPRDYQQTCWWVPVGLISYFLDPPLANQPQTSTVSTHFLAHFQMKPPESWDHCSWHVFWFVQFFLVLFLFPGGLLKKKEVCRYTKGRDVGPRHAGGCGAAQRAVCVH